MAAANGVRSRLFRLLAGIVCLLVAYGCLLGGYHFYYRHAYPREYQLLVEEQSAQRQLPQSLVYAVIHTESGFDPQAISSVGAKGLMQLTDPTLEWVQYRLGHETTDSQLLFEPKQNITYGCALLRLLLDEFLQPATALAAYHAGWGNVQQWLADERYSSDGVNLTTIPIPETADYVQKVLLTQQIYQNLYQIP